MQVQTHSATRAVVQDSWTILQVSSYAKAQNGLELVGCYHANERFNDTDLGTSARKVADKLYSHNELACALLVRLACYAALEASLLQSIHSDFACSSTVPSYRAH